MKAEFRANRTRAKIHGTAERPRLSVNISNAHVTAQLAYATTVGSKQKGSKKELAAFIGSEIAKKAKKAKIEKVVFDRGARLYAGRMSSLADAARKEGLEF